ncbi:MULTISPECIES: flagellar motor protein MotB [Bacillus]|uniref:flagellar motor protein MotB n=1 Tax=Bacillus TaxID=1386 RepID=UPI0003FC6B0C|nr:MULTISPECIES: flagellar motor protein MotB [Bacillus]QHZ46549.1 flagellar motor protein MotB [Bacillus sp. NSP9.1]WFA06678.1 flagellar motor protein MotB [Bacillus sp. HSf4]
MARKKKHKDHEEHVDESWLIPYADLLTLLLALFIVLFAMSSIDAKKFEMLSKSFNAVFTGGTGMMDYSSFTEPKTSTTEEGKSPDEPKDIAKIQKEKDRQSLKKIQDHINQFIKKKNLEKQVNTKLTDEGLLLSIEDNIFFDSGKAEIRPQDVQLAKEVSDLLVLNPPRNIVISGHTDNVPIKNSQFKSNWHLSVMRAVNFMSLLIENPKLDPKIFSAKGYGEYKPIAPNDTEEGRRKNRRVEILILPIDVKNVNNEK